MATHQECRLCRTMLINKSQLGTQMAQRENNSYLLWKGRKDRRNEYMV